MVLPLVSVVIPNYNGAAYLESCLGSLARQTYSHMEILVVDNASQDGSLSVARRVFPHAVVLSQTRNLGFAAGVNAGVRAARGEWIAVLNNDTEVSRDWMAQCVAAIDRHPDASFLACRILDFRDRRRLYSAGDCFLRAGVGYRRGQAQKDRMEYLEDTEIFSACGCAGLFRRSVLEKEGGFDETFFAYLEDVELGLRLQAAGYRGYYIGSATVYHHGGATSGGEFSSLAVRLRTRNSLLLLLKSLPAGLFWRWLPMIAAAQIAWLARVMLRGKLTSYVRGLAGVFPLIPMALAGRARMRSLEPESIRRLWPAILGSETLARVDFSSRTESVSFFLKWYFRVF